ncbi:MAG TPA: hypothetical protein VFB79_10840 [Candidatus Angelobacter sp.]|nr:hypothetical protein [Candidatus Angelobacter sp.]
MNKSELLLAICGTTLQICLFIQLLRLRAYQQFPIFCTYVGFSILSAVVATATNHHVKTYFYVYWTSEAFYVVLSFLVIQEAFRSVFRNFYSLRGFKLSFPGIGVLILFIAFIRVIFFRPHDSNPAVVTLFSLEIAVGFLQFAVFFVFILLVRFFHMRWRQLAFGIVLGFGIASAGSLVAFLLRSEFGKNLEGVLRIMTPLSYIIGVAVWLAIFLKGENSELARNWDSTLTPEQMISELRRHTEAVKGILGR